VRIERLRKEHGVKVRWVHFPLHPETPTEGRSLEELFRGRGYDVPKMQAQMRARMGADTQPGGEAIHDALFKAYFVEGRNIGEVEELLKIAKSIGLPEDEARQVLEKRTFKAAIDADWEKSRQYGVTGVPTFVAGGHGVVGAQPYETLVQLIESTRT
jgi:predicted DsbA family dithiol-disulfide isomerase